MRTLCLLAAVVASLAVVDTADAKLFGRRCRTCTPTDTGVLITRCTPRRTITRDISECTTTRTVTRHTNGIFKLRKNCANGRCVDTPTEPAPGPAPTPAPAPAPEDQGKLLEFDNLFGFLTKTRLSL
jgi:hypothetical protein